MELSDKELKRYNITREQLNDLNKIGWSEMIINTLEKDIVYKRDKKIENIKNKL